MHASQANACGDHMELRVLNVAGICREPMIDCGHNAGNQTSDM